MDKIKSYIVNYFKDYECVFEINTDNGIEYSFRIDEDNDILITIYKGYLLLSVNQDTFLKFTIVNSTFIDTIDHYIKTYYKNVYLKINRNQIIKNIIA